jgi:hypothetical protein
MNDRKTGMMYSEDANEKRADITLNLLNCHDMSRPALQCPRDRRTACQGSHSA